jgi:hypothetical protein
MAGRGPPGALPRNVEVAALSLGLDGNCPVLWTVLACRQVRTHNDRSQQRHHRLRCHVHGTWLNDVTCIVSCMHAVTLLFLVRAVMKPIMIRVSVEKDVPNGHIFLQHFMTLHNLLCNALLRTNSTWRESY